MKSNKVRVIKNVVSSILVVLIFLFSFITFVNLCFNLLYVQTNVRGFSMQPTININLKNYTNLNIVKKIKLMKIKLSFEAPSNKSIELLIPITLEYSKNEIEAIYRVQAQPQILLSHCWSNCLRIRRG